METNFGHFVYSTIRRINFKTNFIWLPWQQMWLPWKVHEGWLWENDPYYARSIL